MCRPGGQATHVRIPGMQWLLLLAMMMMVVMMMMMMMMIDDEACITTTSCLTAAGAADIGPWGPDDADDDDFGALAPLVETFVPVS